MIEELARIIIARSEWGARAPRYNPGPFDPPHLGIALHWTDSPKADPLHWPRCYQQVAGIQKWHQDHRRWDDIGYNVLVCNHGFVFEGKGWDRQPTAQGVAGGGDENDDHFAMAWIGGPGDKMHPAAKRAFGLVIDHVTTELGFPRVLRPHSFFKNTTCPGDEIRSLIASGEWDAPAPPAPVDPGNPGELVPILAPPSVSLAQMQRYGIEKGCTRRWIELQQVVWSFSLDLGVDPAVPSMITEHETGRGHFTKNGQPDGPPGVLDPSFHNWGGIKKSSGGGNFDPGAHHRFASDAEGIMAVVQHAALYAGVWVPPELVVDPRHFAGIRGQAPHLEHAKWTWASGGHGATIARKVRRLRLV